MRANLAEPMAPRVLQLDPSTVVAEPLLAIDDLKTHIRTRGGLARVVDGVTLSVRRGQTLAVVGESGSGKSMLARSIMGIVPEPPGIRAGGRVLFDGRDLRSLSEREMSAIRGRDIAMVFQDPMTSLNPVLRIGEQIAEVVRHHLGMDRAAARTRAHELLVDVGIPLPERRLDEYPHQLSGGLRQRVLIAIALACRPRLLIADEPTTALDVSIQAQILRLLKQYQRDNHMAMIFVSHDLGTVAGLADEIAVMYAGRIVERGPAAEVLAAPRMPYTEGLLRSIPRLDAPSHGRLEAIRGRPPVPTALPSGCAFRARCPYARERCAEETPLPGTGAHVYACWYPRPVLDRTEEAR